MIAQALEEIAGLPDRDVTLSRREFTKLGLFGCGVIFLRYFFKCQRELSTYAGVPEWSNGLEGKHPGQLEVARSFTSEVCSRKRLVA